MPGPRADCLPGGCGRAAIGGPRLQVEAVGHPLRRGGHVQLHGADSRLESSAEKLLGEAVDQAGVPGWLTAIPPLKVPLP